MTVLVCGGRKWRNYKVVWRELSDLQIGNPGMLTLVHGAAPGADRYANAYARRYPTRWIIKRFPADWDKFGKAAGPIRNRKMLIEGKPDLVLAFTGDLASSRGTANMVGQARAAGVPVKVVSR